MAARHTASLKKLPAVGTLLTRPELAPLFDRFGRAVVTEGVRVAIDRVRKRILAGEDLQDVQIEDVERAVEDLCRRSLRRVHNATGVALHTNLGRAPLAKAAEEALLDVARGYSTVEFDLEAGERGSRHAHVSGLIAQLLDAEAGIAVNNCAGAVLLMLAAIARGGEVIVARGELVEIGGGFRVPDVMRESGAELVEVGTTNKVYVRDYEAAITERTRAILSVHRSNFALVGFTHEPSIGDLAELAQKKGLPLLVDLGSGLLAEDRDLKEVFGIIAAEPRPKAALAAGADLVAFSGDKLLGGPQAGILAGRTELVERVKKHPLARALRADKLTLAALEATLRLYRDERVEEIPLIRTVSASSEALEARAQRLKDELQQLRPDLSLTVCPSQAVVGGGSLPLARLPSTAVLVGPTGAYSRALMKALRAVEPPVIARIEADRVALDVRTLEDDVLSDVAQLVAAASDRAREVLE